MLCGVARCGVYGVGHASSVVGDIVVAVVAAGGEGAVGERQHGLQFVAR